MKTTLFFLIICSILFTGCVKKVMLKDQSELESLPEKLIDREVVITNTANSLITGMTYFMNRDSIVVLPLNNNSYINIPLIIPTSEIKQIKCKNSKAVNGLLLGFGLGIAVVVVSPGSDLSTNVTGAGLAGLFGLLIGSNSKEIYNLENINHVLNGEIK